MEICHAGRDARECEFARGDGGNAGELEWDESGVDGRRSGDCGWGDVDASGQGRQWNDDRFGASCDVYRLCSEGERSFRDDGRRHGSSCFHDGMM